MKSKSFFIIGLIYSIIFCFCQTKTPPENFDIKGSSTIILKNETRDTLKINIENWYQFPSKAQIIDTILTKICLLYTSPSPRDQRGSRMPSSA